MFPFRMFPRIYLALAFVFGVVVFGSVGYVLVEGYTWVEALYMTVITVSTVGFGEVRELSDNGMVFTTVLIMGSLGTFAYSISALTTYFVNGEYRNTFKEARLKHEVDKLSGHVIVCGLGRVGEMAVQELLDHATPVVVLEGDAEKAERLAAEGMLVISGDATRDENLESAGITRAKSVITTLPDDAQNLYVVLAAREMAPGIHIISRASNRIPSASFASRAPTTSSCRTKWAVLTWRHLWSCRTFSNFWTTSAFRAPTQSTSKRFQSMCSHKGLKPPR